jgi:hypothetical protein
VKAYTVSYTVQPFSAQLSVCKQIHGPHRSR